jgi:Tol biopolymer transport system component/predicted Ser/Thr protein kinase
VIPDNIAHYRISSQLGEGATGKVYRATDGKLGREVAIKVIPDAFAADPVRMARFTREAQVLASLNHPNIAAIYAVEDRALVMELVEGQTLAERIARGAIPLDEALGFARQIAEGLSAAHDKGIVHRDLKPANLKITPDGTIKLLDFGLAKSDSPWTSSSVDDAPTLTVATTGAGVIVGTAAYMSPEQARGKQVDKRADIWAFGAIVYEMLTGSRLFAGETITDVLASVVQRDPDLSSVPANVQRLLRRCLEKDPRQRIRDAGDAMLLFDSRGDERAAPAPAQRSVLLAVSGIAALVVIALAWLAFAHFRETPPAAEVLRFQIGLPDNVQFTQFGVVSISPDGRKVAFSAYGADAEPRVWVRALDSPTATSLTGAGINQVPFPFFWSPDSRFVAFEQGGRLKKIPAEGGTVQVIAERTTPVQGQWVQGGSWNRDNVIVFGTSDGIMRVSADGGTVTPLTRVEKGEGFHAFPAFLPDGQRFLYLRGGLVGSRSIAVGNLNESPSAQSTTPVLKTDFAAYPVPTATGGLLKLLFRREATLFAQDFDGQTLALTGEPVPLVDRVAAIPIRGLAYFSASNTGTLVYRADTGDDRQLTWFDREGRVTGTAGDRGPYGSLQLSPDGTKAAVVPNVPLTTQLPNNDIWIVDTTKGATSRLTFDPGSDTQPTWSPDGKWIAWQSRGIKESAFLRKAADGSGVDERLDTSEEIRALTDWTNNGYLIFHSMGDIWALPVSADAAGNRKPITVVTSPAFEVGGRVSPDNRWIAYISNQTGRQEMFVQPFGLGGNAATGKWQVSTRGTMGTANWRNDSREFTFVSGEGAIVAVDVASGAGFQSGTPRTLFELPRELFAIITQTNLVAATRDNQRFMMIVPVRDNSQREIGVFVNWASTLRRD